MVIQALRCLGDLLSNIDVRTLALSLASGSVHGESGPPGMPAHSYCDFAPGRAVSIYTKNC